MGFKSIRRDLNEKLFYLFTMFAAFLSIVILSGIIFSLFKEGVVIFKEYGFFKFIFGTAWYPTHEPAEFGIFPLILGSLIVTGLTMVIAVPFGVGSAVFISEVAKPGWKEILKPIVEMLAGIPSVIFGLFGMAFLAPFLQKSFGMRTGFTAVTAAIILGIMVIPIISSISEDAINSVPKNIREASLALGANKWETIVKVVLPAAKSGIITSIILGIGRAIGETMVVLMVAGGAARMPKGFLDAIINPVRPMTSSIASEMGETPIGSEHYHALWGMAIVLFVITFVLNIITEIVRDRVRNRHKSV